MAYVFRPNAVTEIAGRRLTAAEAGLERLTVTSALGCHGMADLVLWPQSAFASAAPGETLTLSLGPQDDEETVLTGTVATQRQGTGAVVIQALDASGALGRLRTTAVFERTSLADIVHKLADEAGVRAEADGDEMLPIYYVLPDRPVWDHLRDLARLTGRDLAVGADGCLLFRDPGAGAVHGLRHGADLIRWSIGRESAAAELAHAPHGSASSSGNWHWIDPDPAGATPSPTRIEGVLSDRDLATTATGAASERAGRAALEGWLLITGDAAIRPGDSVTVADLPGGDPGPMRVRMVGHRLDRDTGFTTFLQVEGGGSAGGLLGFLP